MGQQIEASFTGQAKCVRVAACRDPDGQFGLDRAWKEAHAYVLPRSIAPRDGAASPQLAYCFKLPHHDLLAIRVVLRRKNKILIMPSGRDGDPHPAARQMIYNCPFLSHADRIVQGKNNTPGSDLEVF